MSDKSANNKRIAKNTLLLYGRQLFVMVVTLYVSRVVLSSLGVEDYGIYNVIGGLITMFIMVSGSLSSAISRFITFELGKNDLKKMNTVFSTSINIQICIAIIVVLLCETLGVWFLNSQMNIPEGRIFAANWVLQLSLLIFVLNLISIPYNASMIAHEDMNAIAVISIIDVLLKLVVALLLIGSPFDKLVFYMFLLTVEAFVIRIIYGFYCNRKYVECTYHFVYDRNLLKEMFKFAGWNFFGVGAYTLNTQGVNILMNLFFGVTVNAARGVATQVNSAISQFVYSFTTAINPQITKSYAVGDYPYMYSLICRSSKFASYLYLIMAIPLMFEAPIIFRLWLGEVPGYAVLFFRLSLFTIFIDIVLCNSLMTAIFATGDIKKYQVYVTLFGFLVFLITWAVYYWGGEPEITYIVYFCVYSVVLVVRLLVVREKTSFSIALFLREVIKPIAFVTVIGVIPILIESYLLPPSFIRVLITIILSVLSLCSAIFVVGLNVDEYIYVLSIISKFLSRFKR